MSNETVQKGYRCRWQIHYHILFPVKYRKALLDKEVTTAIIETAEGSTERYAIEMEAIGADRDRIHLFCSAHPKIVLGRIVQIFKSITAGEIFQRKPPVKSSGQTATLSPQWASMPIGIQWISMSKSKVNSKPNTGSQKLFD